MKSSQMLSRRAFIGAVSAICPTFSFPGTIWAEGSGNLSQLIVDNGFSETTSAVLFDLNANHVAESYNKDLQLPLASVTKAVTAVYGLETIGKNYRFCTDFKSDGIIMPDGTLEGNLYLIGGGDPALSINDLEHFVKVLKNRGIIRISGELFYNDKWFPHFTHIDPSQLPEESFNPGLSGLNLNDNKVLFSWKKGITGYNLKIISPGTTTSTSVPNIKIDDVSDLSTSYKYSVSELEGVETWNVSRRILGKGGVRWLPVRLPSQYASEVLRSLLLENNILVPPPRRLSNIPESLHLLFRHESKDLNDLVRDILDRSTNVAAELVGMHVAKLWGVKTSSIRNSGQVMTKWFNYVTSTNGSIFANHSGLSTDSRVSCNDFVKFLKRPETLRLLSPILKKKATYGAGSSALSAANVDIVAKTGTMHFNRGLAGYIRKNEVPKAAFAIFTADIEKKFSIPDHRRANPPGSKPWLSRAKSQENKILSNWAAIYA